MGILCLGGMFLEASTGADPGGVDARSPRGVESRNRRDTPLGELGWLSAASFKADRSTHRAVSRTGSGLSGEIMGRPAVNRPP